MRTGTADCNCKHSHPVVQARVLVVLFVRFDERYQFCVPLVLPVFGDISVLALEKVLSVSGGWDDCIWSPLVRDIAGGWV